MREAPRPGPSSARRCGRTGRGAVLALTLEDDNLLEHDNLLLERFFLLLNLVSGSLSYSRLRGGLRANLRTQRGQRVRETNLL